MARTRAAAQKREDCLFCKIVSGAQPAAIVYEDEQFVAFLDHRPLFPGHVLLCPRIHYETLPDVPADLVGPMFLTGQTLTRAAETAMQADGSFLAINNRVSQSVPHLHLHIVPRKRGDGLRGFFWPRTKYATDAEMETVRAAIAHETEKLFGKQ